MSQLQHGNKKLVACNKIGTFEAIVGPETLHDVTIEPPAVRSNWIVPAASRVPDRHAQRSEILARHGAAVEAGLPTYADPVSGFSVFTAAFLEARKYCCESGCRHCPYVAE